MSAEGSPTLDPYDASLGNRLIVSYRRDVIGGFSLGVGKIYGNVVNLSCLEARNIQRQIAFREQWS